MLKQVIAFLFFIAFATQTFGQAIIVSNFYLNQNYIAKKLCENKDKPLMKCCGKCQLSKRLNKQEKQDQQNPERKNNKNEIFSSTSYFPDFISVTFSSPILFKSHLSFAGQLFSSCIFHPPSLN